MNTDRSISKLVALRTDFNRLSERLTASVTLWFPGTVSTPFRHGMRLGLSLMKMIGVMIGIAAVNDGMPRTFEGKKLVLIVQVLDEDIVMGTVGQRRAAASPLTNLPEKGQRAKHHYKDDEECIALHCCYGCCC